MNFLLNRCVAFNFTSYNKKTVSVRALLLLPTRFFPAFLSYDKFYILIFNYFFPLIGFPLGYNSTESKLVEARTALANGANEIDMVVNISDVKNGDYQKVENEIRAVKSQIGGHILKVIVETCYLDKEEKIAMCKAVTEAKADYIKTSTGFGPQGAKLEDVKLFKKYIGENVKIKAAGGINTLEDLLAFLDLGCDRIGTSKAVGLLKKADF